ncbi:uncharacterized protein METZ01_LOCUS384950 [marine metagenome]|uniref:Uncharacterized protein n=1 Tax=marine metagenome TaxID=408172 RepID=A0A382UCV3_9ZZZZ
MKIPIEKLRLPKSVIMFCLYMPTWKQTMAVDHTDSDDIKN